MTLAEFTGKLVAKKIDRLMVWTGPEAKLMDLMLNQIAKLYQLEIKRVDTVQEIMTKIQSKKISGGARLYVIRDDSDVWDVENFVNKMEVLLDRDKVVLIYTNMDKRKKFYKESDAVEFDYLEESVLVGYVGNEVQKYSAQFDSRNRARLVQICERDYSRILLELDKIKQYADSCKISWDDSFTELWQSGMIYAPVGDILFEMTDAVVGKDKHTAYRLLYALYRKGESPIKILSILYTNYRNLLMIQGTDKGAGISERTGLTPWQVRLASSKSGIWSQSKIKSILKILQDCESGVKNGKYDERTAIEVAMEGILG